MKRSRRMLAGLLALVLALSNLGMNNSAYAAGFNEEMLVGGVSAGDAEDMPTVSAGDTDEVTVPQDTVSAGDVNTEVGEEVLDSVSTGDAGLKNEIAVSGENSFGAIFSNELKQEISEQQENNGYNVFSIEVVDGTAIVDFESVEDAALIVGIYAEDGNEMLTTASVEVAAGERTAAVELDAAKVPQYFYVRGYLVDSLNYRPLCAEYESPMYTQEMQEFLAKTTADFDADRVLNLDADETNNFAVYGEGTIVIPEKEGYNEVVSADETSNTYVIENADESITSLQPGDIFAYPMENEVLIVKVAGIQMDGTTVTVIGAEASMEEVFDYVKIDMEAGSGQAVVDTSSCDEGVTYEGLVDYVDEDAPQTFVEIEGSVSKAFEMTLDKEIEQTTSGGSAKAQLSGGLKLELGFSAKMYLTLEEQYLEVKLDYSAKIFAEISGELKAELPLITVGFWFYGVVVELTPSIIFKAEATVSIDGTLSGTVGFRVQAGKEIKNLTTIPEFKPTLKVEGSIYLGFSLEPKIAIISDKVANVSLEATVGAEANVVLQDPFVPVEDKKHECNVCFAGEINGKFDLSASAELLKLWEYNLTILDESIKLLDFYYSADRDEFGLLSCPYYVFRTKITVLDELWKPMQGASVTGEKFADTYLTDENGQTEIWLQEGKYRFRIKKEGFWAGIGSLVLYDSGKELRVQLMESKGQGGDNGDGEPGDGGDTEGGGTGGDGNGGSGDIEGTEKRVAQVSLGHEHSAAITEDGDLYLWGENYYWQLGQSGGGTNLDSNGSSVPLKLMSNVRAASLGSSHSAAITEEGDLYLWGDNWFGKLGNGTQEDSNVPVKIMDNVKEIRLGVYNSAAITEVGDLFIWGRDADITVGDGVLRSSSVPLKIMSNVKSVSLSEMHSAAITESGDLYLWGYNSHGQLGNGTDLTSDVPLKIMSNVKEVSLGWCYSAAITEEGDLYLWGNNYEGQLGDGTNLSSSVPLKIMSNVKSVCLGNCHSAAITEEGDVYLWGYNFNHELGNGVNEHSNVPIKILDSVKSVSLGCSHSAAITEDGELYMWGANAYGQLGNGTTESSNVPIKITIPFVDTPAVTTFSSLPEPMFMTMSRTQQNWNGIKFTNLLPNEVYNYYIMNDSDAEQPLAGSNLSYIGQAVSDADGNLNVRFMMKEEYADADIFAVPMKPIDISDVEVAVSDLTYNGEMQYAPIEVTYQGTPLEMGQDYYVQGDYGVTEAGEYSITIEGTGLYAGTLTATYKVEAAGVEVTGTLSCFGDENAQTTLQLLDSTDNVAAKMSITGNSATYSFDNIPAGTYTLEVSRQNHVTREYAVNVADAAVTQDVEIHLLGDVTGDGDTTVKDQKKVYNHIAKISTLSDYDFVVGDVTGDGDITVKDQKKIYNHIAKISLIW